MGIGLPLILHGVIQLIQDKRNFNRTDKKACINAGFWA
jgi:hypothetical protein